ncbi:DUF6462 family protein [Butyrivibrio sp. INlla21]|uniref:DUF6462 family protein n=1 Tax=Butyrivibrio sp. INlla21 TaxID=1520811 RepID=UPI0008F02AC9|nr:DUF6462 family protein [Butyrivibrio sp. INlla21]SFU88815.1 hypothetical protein SAMN02910342_02220 [Butyrivibrio sp. INlla21]
MAKKRKEGPDLEKYLTGNENHYATYLEGADQYSMAYYSFKNLVREAKAGYKLRKEALVIIVDRVFQKD